MVDAALALGAAAAKAACKIWLKDNSFASDMSAKITDVVEAKVSGIRERRRIGRFFEDIEEKMADNILSILQNEYRDLEEHERNAAVLAAAKTFEKADLATGDIFAVDLDPTYLARYVKKKDPTATSDLSSGATELYTQIVAACSAYTIGVARSLPNFEVGAFAALLSRQADTIERLDKLAASFERSALGTRVEFFVSSYRQLVTTQLGHIQLFGFSASDAFKRYPLTTSYITLNLTNKSASSPARQAGDEKLPSAPLLNSTIPANLAISTTSRVLIRGEAGSGKTTLLQWLAVNSAEQSFTGPLRDWNNLTPFFIRLRQYVGANLPSPENFLEGIGRHIADEMPRNWVHSKLRRGEAVVLVDGVDELPEAQRDSARIWLSQLITTFPDAKYVVTSRPSAASVDWLELADFSAMEIMPMAAADTRDLVHHWHTALRSIAVDADELASIDEAETELKRALTVRRHLRQIATSPLLAAMLCALHIDRRMQIPTDRLELYAVAIEALIDRRDLERQISSESIQLPRAAKMLLLEDIAYWLIRNGLSNATRERLISRIEQRLVAMPRVKNEPSTALAYLLNRSGLLREPIPGTIDFIHRTFQEYLAARAAIDSDDIELLIRSADNDQWREVILMACGHAHAEQRERLLRGILDRAAAEAGNSAMLQAIAVGCLQTSPQLSLDLKQAIERAAGQLVPPKGVAEATALAAAGDLALELLPATPARSSRSAAATIRMASLVGGEHALQVIEKYALRSNSGIRSEIHQAWDHFDPIEYARRVLSKRQLDLGFTIDDPGKIAALSHLDCTWLSCRFPGGYGSLAFVGDIPRLTYLSIDKDQLLTDLSPLLDHPGIESLRLIETGAVNLGQLASAHRIVKLEIDQESCHVDLHQLSGFEHLKQLQLLNSGVVESVLQSLSPEARYDRLGFWRASEVVSLGGFLDSPTLEQLDFLLLGRATSLKSIAGISRWAATCTGLYLQAPKLDRVDDLRQLPRLRFLNLAYCPISDLSAMANLTELSILHVGGRSATPSLEPLRDLTNLRHLALYGDDPVDLTPLAGKSGLEVLVGRRGKHQLVGRQGLGSGVKLRSGSI